MKGVCACVQGRHGNGQGVLGDPNGGVGNREGKYGTVVKMRSISASKTFSLGMFSRLVHAGGVSHEHLLARLVSDAHYILCSIIQIKLGLLLSAYLDMMLVPPAFSLTLPLNLLFIGP